MKWKIGFGIMFLIAVLAIVYGYVQTTIAMETRREALAAKEMADQQRISAEQARAEADRQRLAAEQQATLCMSTLKELEELKKKKK